MTVQPVVLLFHPLRYSGSQEDKNSSYIQVKTLCPSFNSKVYIITSGKPTKISNSMKQTLPKVPQLNILKGTGKMATSVIRY
jgi:hypothetical protein